MRAISGTATDLRCWLTFLDTRGELARLGSSIDPDQAVAAVLERADGHIAVRFDDVTGAAFPLVGNTVPDRAHLGLALGCDPLQVADRFAAALDDQFQGMPGTAWRRLNVVEGAQDQRC